MEWSACLQATPLHPALTTTSRPHADQTVATTWGSARIAVSYRECVCVVEGPTIEINFHRSRYCRSRYQWRWCTTVCKYWPRFRIPNPMFVLWLSPTDGLVSPPIWFEFVVMHPGPYRCIEAQRHRQLPAPGQRPLSLNRITKTLCPVPVIGYRTSSGSGRAGRGGVA